jgi:hypothetical protein
MPRPPDLARFALALLLASGVARAAEPAPAPAPAPEAAPASASAVGATATPAPRPNRRAIADHEFLPSTTVGAPLAVSSFGMDERLTYGSATGQIYDADGLPTGRSRTYNWGGIVSGVRFQTALGDEFIIRGGFTVSLFSGTDSRSALVVGTTVQPGVQLGAEWSHALGDALRIGVSLDVDDSPQLNLLIMAAIANALQNGGIVEGAGALQQNNVVTWAPSFTAAWVPHRAVGLVGRVGYVNSGLETVSKGTLRREAIALGVAADLDLRAFWPTVPVGTSLTYADSVPIGSSIAGVRDAALNVMYTGNPSLALGAVLGVQALKIRPQYPDPLKSTTPYLTFVMRAYWP